MVSRVTRGFLLGGGSAALAFIFTPRPIFCAKKYKTVVAGFHACIGHYSINNKCFKNVGALAGTEASHYNIVCNITMCFILMLEM